MRHGARLSTLLILGLAAIGVPAASAPERVPTTIVVVGDSALAGAWSAIGEPARLLIASGPEGRPVARLTIGDRLEASGEYNGFAYSGSVRTLARAGAEQTATPAVIHVVRIDSSRVHVRLEQARTAAPAWSSIFTRVSQGAATGLPRLGEYVQVETLPQAEHREPSLYPEDARRQRISGTVIVQALVDTEGRVRDTRVSRSIPALDAAAVTAVWKWRFKPATFGGEPVAVWVAVPVKFSLP